MRNITSGRSDGVRFDHRGDAGHVDKGRGGEQAQGDGLGTHGSHLTPHPAAQVGHSRRGRTV